MAIKRRESVSEANDLMTKAIALLRNWEVPTDPINFAVAYEVAKGTNKGLMEKYELFMFSGRKVDNYCLEQWQLEFLQSQQLNQAGLISSLDKVLTDVQNHVRTSGGSVDNFLTDIDSSMSQLSGIKNADDIKTPLKSILTATQTLKSEHDQLKDQLAVSQSESQALKSELDKLQREATTDTLTSLLNRRGLEQYLQSVGSKTMKAMVLDIDHFKRFNDTFGHLIGDVVIAKVADQLNKALPDDAKAIRYGGEEFVVVSPEQNLDAMKALAERIRLKVSSMKLINGKTKERLPTITVSLGVAEQSKDETFEALISRADEALYKAKENGRNQVQLAI
ncbi:hypothetical protein C2869_00500 [Saccharobesus litoralis]|uniref:diguanylate cyclase n=1 Tax=Saccharobesus litoralis TaxID=2172099 RepID=A0A2S0VLD4_9ALTE|nr:GGDEF domain-containing protein [Saccharobesus litoralis]AWB65011.1 hypothetical protein C2869_00500 [Saccharobesus litoralis]